MAATNIEIIQHFIVSSISNIDNRVFVVSEFNLKLYLLKSAPIMVHGDWERGNLILIPYSISAKGVEFLVPFFLLISS